MRFWHACAPATAHELPTSENWDQTSLGEVIGRALKPFDERFLIQGPELRVPAKASLMLTMCMHELATNAAKYGALSNACGTVQVARRCGGQALIGVPGEPGRSAALCQLQPLPPTRRTWASPLVPVAPPFASPLPE
jgi:hypothetical protein